jgi:hypothetical protein
MRVIVVARVRDSSNPDSNLNANFAGEREDSNPKLQISQSVQRQRDRRVRSGVEGGRLADDGEDLGDIHFTLSQTRQRDRRVPSGVEGSCMAGDGDGKQTTTRSRKTLVGRENFLCVSLTEGHKKETILAARGFRDKAAAVGLLEQGLQHRIQHRLHGRLPSAQFPV